MKPRKLKKKVDYLSIKKKTTVNMILAPQGEKVPTKQPSSSAILITFNLIIQIVDAMQNHPQRKQLTNWE